VPEDRRGQKCQGTGGHLVVILKDAKNPTGMFKVGEFLNTIEACDAIFQNIGWLPALKSYIAQADPTAYPGLDFYFKSVTDANDWRGPEPCPITEFINTAFVELHEKVDRDELTPPTLLQSFKSGPMNTRLKFRFLIFQLHIEVGKLIYGLRLNLCTNRQYQSAN
jgi:hypothetical protein